MSESRKYYYLKLKDNFFETEELKILESMPNGYKYSNILLKMYLKSLKFEGALKVNEYIPYDQNMIAAVTGHDIDTVIIAFDVFQRLKLVEVLDNGVIYMLNIQNYIGKSTTEADRKRDYRNKIEKEKMLLLEEGTGDGQMSDISPPENRDKENRDKENRDKDIENTISLYDLSIQIIKNIEKLSNGKYQIISKQQEIQSLIEIYGVDWVSEAAEIAVDKKKCNISYIKGILKTWTNEGKVDKSGIRSNNTKSNEPSETTKKLREFTATGELQDMSRDNVDFKF